MIDISLSMSTQNSASRWSARLFLLSWEIFLILAKWFGPLHVVHHNAKDLERDS
uniref:Uncharacterized protein n=1 Tax=Arundo donax TaxID=35708 RepID=A0A0A8YCS5_ARUDO